MAPPAKRPEKMRLDKVSGEISLQDVGAVLWFVGHLDSLEVNCSILERHANSPRPT